jgi:hypothetical protein
VPRTVRTVIGTSSFDFDSFMAGQEPQDELIATEGLVSVDTPFGPAIE